MNVRFLYKHVEGKFVFEKGEVVNIGRQFGKSLAKKGIATPTDEPSPKDKLGEQKKATDAQEIFEDYPELSKEIRGRIRHEDNEHVLRMFLDDKRKTVRDEARKRLNSIIYGSE